MKNLLKSYNRENMTYGLVMGLAWGGLCYLFFSVPFWLLLMVGLIAFVLTPVIIAKIDRN